MILKVCLFITVTFGALACGEAKEAASEEGDDNNHTPVTGSTSPSQLPSGVGSLSLEIGLHTLPGVTDPVLLDSKEVEGKAEEFDASTGTIAVGDFGLTSFATAGIDLSFATTSEALKKIDGLSYGACEMVNRARGFLHMAGKADSIDCELSILVGDAGEFYDGKPHILKMVETEDGETETMSYRFTIEGTSDSVTGYTVQACENGKQHYYMKKSINDGVGEVHSKVTSVPGNPQVDLFTGITDVVGGINAKGKFNGLKTIIQDYSNKFSNGSVSYVRELIVQSSKNVQYEGYFNESSGPSQSIRSFSELIDENTEGPYFLSKIKLGNGAMIFQEDAEIPVIQGWNASTLKVDNTAAQIAKIEETANSMPSEPATKKVLTFEGDEAWDCTGDPDYIIDYLEFEKFLESKMALALQGGGDEGDGPGQEGGDDEDDIFYEICGSFQLPQDSYIQCHDFASKEGK